VRRSNERLPDLRNPETPLGVAILIRGLISWPDDKTFKQLEYELQRRNIEVVRFSYHKHGFSHYWPLDTFGRLDRFASIL